MLHLSEPRFNTDLSVRVFGIDADSRPFSIEFTGIDDGTQKRLARLRLRRHRN